MVTILIWRPLYKHGLTLISAWKIHYIHYVMILLIHSKNSSVVWGMDKNIDFQRTITIRFCHHCHHGDKMEGWGTAPENCHISVVQLLYNNLESYDNLEFQVVVRNLEIDERSVNPANIALWSSITYAITSSHHK